MWQKDRSADAAGRLENLKELVRSMEEFENLQGFLEHISLVMDTDERRRRRSRLDHDAARREGSRVRHRVPARLGGRHHPAPAHARREGPRRPRRRTPPRPCRHHPRAQTRQDFLCRQPAHPRLVDQSSIPSRFIDELPAESVEVAESQGRLRQLRRLRRPRLALRQGRIVRLELFDAGLAARAARAAATALASDEGFEQERRRLFQRR